MTRIISPSRSRRIVIRLLGAFVLLAQFQLVYAGGEPTLDRLNEQSTEVDIPTTETAVATVESDADALQAGHSKHGEAFNEGPRQKAYLMQGTGKISFEVTSEQPQVRPFIEQGIGQLHGFWFFEAERSFRQAAMFDPHCAIAYWGMARANENNEDRAKKFIDEALQLIDHASPREQLYIRSLHAFLHGEGEKKDREAKFVTDIEAIVKEFPDDVEAKALLGFALYKYRASANRTFSEVDVVLDQVLDKEKSHPVHHYRIHLWDHESPQRALDSAALCGPAADGIAHMWHMCGHIFSRVKRYGDAAWFQEASARVDHRHMMHDHILPDQIHNFAHNNEWLVRNLINVGRVDDAIALAKNMIELPRHPKYNTLSEQQSASYGRERLLNVLERFELWDELITLANTPYLDPTDDVDQQIKRLHCLGKAQAISGQVVAAEETVRQLQGWLEKVGSELTIAEQQVAAIKSANVTSSDSNADASDPENDSTKADKEQDDKEQDGKENVEIAPEVTTSQDKATEDKATEEEKKQKQEIEDLKQRRDRIEHAIGCANGYLALERGDAAEAISLLEKADEDAMSIAQIRSQMGDHQQAISDASNYQKDRKQQVQPLAGLIEISWKAGDRKRATKAFVELRAISQRIQFGSPVFERLAPIAKELGYLEDWRVEVPDADDLGKRPPLPSLGPFRWQPSPAPEWLLPDSEGQLHSLRDYRGRAVIAILYLGHGCLHCAEQLQAIAPRTEEFAAAGISLIAISTDELRDLEISQRNYDGQRIPFPLVADPDKEVFRDFRAYDDFEGQPLHGTFLIDAGGRICWQDISFEPFMDVDFLLNESKRLLSQGRQVRDNANPTRDLATKQ